MRRNKAFTLIELLLVIIILSVIIVLAVPNFARSFKRMELKKTASDIVYLVRWGQARAAKDEVDYQLVFLDNYTSYRILRAKSADGNSTKAFEPVNMQMGRVFKVPESIKINCDVHTMDIHPDGTLDKVRIDLDGKDTKVIISSVELRGNIFIIEGENES